jgi:hypothetical protein
MLGTNPGIEIGKPNKKFGKNSKIPFYKVKIPDAGTSPCSAAERRFLYEVKIKGIGLNLRQKKVHFSWHESVILDG